ncbi:hypothetical protein OHA91_22920 [Streptomyces erythrochromogenes]|uniref:Uncharacterized protein n=1 Tax=Streptomyces erythrochromogenes TaxID=285574 RepID=A0ABZ1QFE2_9ACTN|nr:hypothetical protein [Streptomyces erythrochromogenes]
MTIVLASAELDYAEEYGTVPVPFAAEPVPSAVLAAEALAAEGLHVHLVAADVQCVSHDCIDLPGT